MTLAKLRGSGFVLITFVKQTFGIVKLYAPGSIGILPCKYR